MKGLAECKAVHESLVCSVDSRTAIRKHVTGPRELKRDTARFLETRSAALWRQKPGERLKQIE